MYLLLLAAVLMGLSYRLSHLTSSNNELRQATTFLSQRISSVTKEIDIRFTPEYFQNNFSQKKLTKEEVERINQLPYEVLLYRNDSLLFWGDNAVIPAQSVGSFANGIGFQKFKNGYYLTYKKIFSNLQDVHGIPRANSKDAVRKPGKTITLLALIPVKYDYVTSNSYLRNHFSDQFELPSYFELSQFQKSNYLPVKYSSVPTIFYLTINENERDSQPGGMSLLLFVSAIVSLLFFLNHLFNQLPQQRNPWVRPALLFVVFSVVVLFFSNKTWLPDDVENWRIFDPVLFASSRVATSLGSLFIQLLFLIWISVHLTNRFRPRFRFSTTSSNNYLAHLCGYFLIFLIVIYSVVVIQSLVRDSKIEFAFINPLQPDYFSILGVLCIALLMFSLFLLSEKIISILHQRPLKWFDNVVALLTCTMIALLYYISSDIGLSGLWIMVWINVFILLLPYFRIGGAPQLNFTRLFLVLVFFASAGAALLYFYGDQKEKNTRQTFARKLISDRDAVTEYLLTGLQKKIEGDPFVNQFFKSPRASGQDLVERLQQLYFQEGFNRYEIRFFAFDKDGILLPGWGEDFGFVTEMGLKSYMQSIGSESDQLYYSSSTSGNIAYLCQYNINDNDTLTGRLFVQLQANAYKSASVYPELLLGEKDKPPVVTPAYSYAIYNKRKLIDQHGNYNYEYRFRWQIPPGAESEFLTQNGSNHLVYIPQNNIVIVVSKDNNSPIFFLSYFSFLFIVMFFLALFLVALNTIVNHPQVRSPGQLFRSASLRSLIHAFFMIFILSILFVTGYVTGKFFLKQFNDLAQTTVKDKMNRVAEAVRYMVDENLNDTLDSHPLLSLLLRKKISQLADVQDNEVNFYNRAGDLLASSQPSIFEKEIIGKKINPIAYYELHKETQTVLVNEEHIGKLRFYSGYESIRDKHGQLIAFVNLPYYNTRQQLNEQVGFFFVTLVNILVIATIIAGLMAPFISRQITSKLSVISEKFKKLRVGESEADQKIQWEAQDEIGELVDEYNNMIDELQKSAEKLARSQRELAWREMAQQVAHEIKNPLTPMKLNIQHLKRAYENNAPNLKELVARVSQTLIEQIDTLSEIATEFSNFAKMPRPEIEDVDVHSILRSAIELHKEYEHTHIHVHSNADNSVVAADRKQLLSVFNNLLLNAVQAIPAEKTGEINIITQNNDGQLTVSVSDDGVGISDDEGKKVFTPNFTTKSSGTGLGLAISKNIIESFGGTISFTSHKNIGTTFYVQLPVIPKSNLS
ncbi:MAG TPA: HAMP domain-containing sensor histidine kinase [Chitinophagales bacterium]|nr:HAMP domain-containing sensor histidine kinase [Chitinophagales bacterium]